MLWSFEILKLARSWRPVIFIAVMCLFVLLMLLGFYTYARTETGGQAQFRYTYENRSYFNGLTFALYCSYFGIVMILPIFAAAEGGAQIAGEVHGRTLQLILARPVSHGRIFATKLLISVTYITLGVGLFLCLALGVGLFAVGWGELNIYPGVLQMSPTHQHLTQAEALVAFLLAWPAASLAMVAPLSMSFLIAAWLRNPVNAVAATVAVYLVLFVISEVHFFRDLRPLLFTTYIGYWRGVFRESAPWPQILRDGAKLLAFSFAFLSVGCYLFRVDQRI
jgi:ABC-type transport system involved in multi-copper enzyme maturation permease subunit